ncbi:hypothetical protein COO60DRAFT_215681 [Scenedesmus sp. NREL 46B-D3]|nr:hypothetical protein COO60DRAFT_215681 [Scenedesmus sp. NREL 46B-D3]
MNPALQRCHHAPSAPMRERRSRQSSRAVPLQQQQNFYYRCRRSCRSAVTCSAAQSDSGSGSSSSSSAAAAPSNLGVLQRVVEVNPGMDDPYGMQRVSVDSFSSRGFYMDGPSIVSSAVLLLVLLGLTFQRILGLDRLVAKAMRDWKEGREYERRNEVLRARQVSWFTQVRLFQHC